MANIRGLRKEYSQAELIQLIHNLLLDTFAKKSSTLQDQDVYGAALYTNKAKYKYAYQLALLDLALIPKELPKKQQKQQGAKENVTKVLESADGLPILDVDPKDSQSIDALLKIKIANVIAKHKLLASTATRQKRTRSRESVPEEVKESKTGIQQAWDEINLAFDEIIKRNFGSNYFFTDEPTPKEKELFTNILNFYRVRAYQLLVHIYCSTIIPHLTKVQPVAINDFSNTKSRYEKLKLDSLGVNSPLQNPRVTVAENKNDRGLNQSQTIPLSFVANKIRDFTTQFKPDVSPIVQQRLVAKENAKEKNLETVLQQFTTEYQSLVADIASLTSEAKQFQSVIQILRGDYRIAIDQQNQVIKSLAQLSKDQSPDKEIKLAEIRENYNAIATQPLENRYNSLSAMKKKRDDLADKITDLKYKISLEQAAFKEPKQTKATDEVREAGDIVKFTKEQATQFLTQNNPQFTDFQLGIEKFRKFSDTIATETTTELEAILYGRERFISGNIETIVGLIPLQKQAKGFIVSAPTEAIPKAIDPITHPEGLIPVLQGAELIGTLDNGSKRCPKLVSFLQALHQKTSAMTATEEKQLSEHTEANAQLQRSIQDLITVVNAKIAEIAQKKQSNDNTCQNLLTQLSTSLETDVIPHLEKAAAEAYPQLHKEFLQQKKLAIDAATKQLDEFNRTIAELEQSTTQLAKIFEITKVTKIKETVEQNSRKILLDFIMLEAGIRQAKRSAATVSNQADEKNANDTPANPAVVTIPLPPPNPPRVNNSTFSLPHFRNLLVIGFAITLSLLIGFGIPMLVVILGGISLAVGYALYHGIKKCFSGNDEQLQQPAVPPAQPQSVAVNTANERSTSASLSRTLSRSKRSHSFSSGLQYDSVVATEAVAIAIPVTPLADSKDETLSPASTPRSGQPSSSDDSNDEMKTSSNDSSPPVVSRVLISSSSAPTPVIPFRQRSRSEQSKEGFGGTQYSIYYQDINQRNLDRNPCPDPLSTAVTITSQKVHQ